MSERRWDIFNGLGTHPSSNPRNWAGYGFLCQVGELDLLHRGETVHAYAVTCAPEKRREECWNASPFDLVDGIIHWGDDDVDVDPYHMCLLYQILEERGELG